MSDAPHTHAKRAPRQHAQIEPVAFRVAPWLKAVAMGRSKLYALPVELRPRSLKLGGARLITESPEKYIERIAALQTA